MRPEQRERAEFLANAFGRFETFCGLIDIIPKDGRRRKFGLNAIQKLFCAQQTGRDVVLKPRQIGFTTLEQARDVYHFLTVPGARVVVTCQSIRDGSPEKLLSGNYRVMFEGLQRAGVSLNFRTQATNEWVLADRDSTLRIAPAGASESSASKKGRAGTVTRLHLTETAFYDYADETLNALLECVPSSEYGSEIVSESTPNGASGYFYRQCQAAMAGRGNYKFHFYPWHKQSEYRAELEPGESVTPRSEAEARLVADGISPEQLKWYQAKVADKGQALVDQEYPSDPETCFLVSGRMFFDAAQTTRLLAAARDPVDTRKSGRVRIYAEPKDGASYIMALDCSEGVGGDPSGGVLINRETAEHAATIDGQFAPHDAAAVAVALCKEYNGALLAPERNNHGHAVIQAAYRELSYRNIYRHADGNHGWPTNSMTRPVMLDALEDAHRKGIWTTPDRHVLAQFRKFIVNRLGKSEAAQGEHDDLVIACAIAWSVRAQGAGSAEYDPEFDSYLPSLRV